MNDDLPEHLDDQRERARSQRERALNMELTNGKHPLKLKHRVIVGVIVGSFLFLVVGCWYWVGLDKPKIDRANFDFKHQPNRTTP